METEVIIFDYGRTLFDNELDRFFEESVMVVEACRARGYLLAIVSYVDLGKGDTPKKRLRRLRDAGLAQHFEICLFATDDPANKDALYAQVIGELEVKPQRVAIVDDRVIRGIRWGNQHGCKTIWLQRGKFASELPNEQTGLPTHRIGSLWDLLELLE